MTTIRDTTAPAAPVGVEDNWAIGWATAVKLYWDANSEKDLAGYRVYRSAAAVVATTPGNLVATVKSPYYEQSLPQTGDDYRYVVTAVDVYGNESPASGTAVYSTLDKTAPTWVPDDLAASDTEHAVTLTWSHAPDYGTFDVYRNGVVVGSGTSTWTDTRLTADTTYTYSLRPVDLAGNRGPASTTVTVHHVGDLVTPEPVTGLTAEAEDDGVSLDWDDSPDSDIDHYSVWFQEVGGSGEWWDAGTTTASELMHQTLPDGERLRYVVVAEDDDGNALNREDPTVASVEVTERDLTPPDGSSGESDIWLLAVDSYDADAVTQTLRWNYEPDHVSDDDATGFLVQRWNPDTLSWESRTSFATTAASHWYYFTDTGVPARSTLFYRVALTHADGTLGEWEVLQNYT
ncbi:hypothetical protein [Streptomyces sp. NPDC008150]|uniref:hypothetical protein n=1 Tax=Streptomyces sp. NPDC008150 TaxID=3364816 RepID=UPI0036E0F0BB